MIVKFKVNSAYADQVILGLAKSGISVQSEHLPVLRMPTTDKVTIIADIPEEIEISSPIEL